MHRPSLTRARRRLARGTLPRRTLPRRTAVLLLATALAVPGPLLSASPATAAVPDAPHCSTAGTWRQGELNIYWFDVEQADAQLIVGPTGRTLLIDLGETAYNATGTSTKATKVAAQIRTICGIASGPVHLDYVMATHHHLDHVGYPGNPNDATIYRNGLYQLLTPITTGGFGFTVGQLLDHDGGVWTDANGDGNCDVGTSTAPAPETDWNNAGTTSTTSKRWICWLYGPATQADRANINGKVLRMTNTTAWPSIDLGTGVSSAVVEANGKSVTQADGVTPVSGDHTADALPPSENDYSVALRTTYGPFSYATTGDADGEYSTSSDGYTYNNVEALLATLMGKVNALKVNHHGSSHSSSATYVNATTPQVAFISCGVNTYGHPANQTLNRFRAVASDIYLSNNPCATTDDTGATINYSGTFNANATVHLATTGAGAGFTVDYSGGTRTYVTRTDGGGGTGDVTKVKVNEFLMAPSTGGTEWVELYNGSTGTVDVSGYYIDDLAGGGGAPKVIPAGTTIPAGGRWVMSFASGYLNNTGTESVRFLKIVGGVETVYDTYTYTLSSTQYDKVFHRIGDGGTWCNAISSNVTKGTPNPTTCP